MQQKEAGIFSFIYAHYMKSLRQIETLIYVFFSWNGLCIFMCEQPVHVGLDNKVKRILLQEDPSYGGLCQHKHSDWEKSHFNSNFTLTPDLLTSPTNKKLLAFMK